MEYKTDTKSKNIRMLSLNIAMIKKIKLIHKEI